MNTLQTHTPRSVIVDTSKSAYVRLRPVPVASVKLEDNFWRPRRELNRQVVIPGQYHLCEDTGRIDNFRRAAGKKQGDFQGWFFNDSDVYKLLEAAAWQLAAGPDSELETLIDGLIDEISAAQQPDGYLNTYYMAERASQRWTNFDRHEMYCAGHLFQAAAAHFRTTGKTSLLDVSVRFAEHLCNRFGPEDQGKHFGADGHPEVEMALVELGRITGDRKFIEQARYFIDARGTGRLGNPFGRFNPSYHQDHLPFQQLSRLDGHSVRAVYLNCGAADLVAETGDADLRRALDRMWDSMVERQMYVTGGLGSRYEMEGFGADYELPNSRAHTETCAAIANFMWNWRMLLLDADARYADLMELTLFNGILSGMALDGCTYFYQNPLSDSGGHRRQPWFAVACCPGNISRLLAQLPGYMYSVSEQTIWVNLYASSTAAIVLPAGAEIKLIQSADYPWSGQITLQTQTPGSYRLALRIPGWCETGYSVSMNGQAIDFSITPGRYLQINREWQAGDTLLLNLPMPVRRLECNPYVVENQGRVALKRGPLLYCIEGADHMGEDIRLFTLPEQAELDSVFITNLLNGVAILRGSAKTRSIVDNWKGHLYRTGVQQHAAYRSTALTAIPYYAWANREAGPMEVWLAVR